MAAALFAVSVASLVLISCVTALTVALFPQAVSGLAGLDRLEPYLVWLPVALIGASIYQAVQGWAVRSNDLTAVSKAQVFQGIASAVFALIAGFAGAGAGGLIGATVGSSWVGIGTQLSRSRDLVSRAMALSAKRIRAAVLRYRHEATWSTLVAVINAASLALPVLMLASFYSAEQVGWYALVSRIAAVPVGVVTRAVGQAFWAESSSLAREGRMPELRAFYLRSTWRLAGPAGVAAAVCLTGPYFIGTIFGEAEWGGAGQVLAALSPAIVGTILFSPTNHLIVLGRQSLQLAADGLRLIAVIAAILLSDLLDQSFVTAVAAASAASLIGHLALFSLHRRLHGQS